MAKGIFWRDGLDLELYGYDVLHYLFDGASLVEETLHDLIYSQNYYFGRDMHNFLPPSIK